jgi:hypothetical protein
LEDFVVDAVTACIGMVIAAGFDWAVQRSRRANAGAS